MDEFARLACFYEFGSFGHAAFHFNSRTMRKIVKLLPQQKIATWTLLGRTLLMTENKSLHFIKKEIMFKANILSISSIASI